MSEEFGMPLEELISFLSKEQIKDTIDGFMDFTTNRRKLGYKETIKQLEEEHLESTGRNYIDDSLLLKTKPKTAKLTMDETDIARVETIARMKRDLEILESSLNGVYKSDEESRINYYLEKIKESIPIKLNQKYESKEITGDTYSLTKKVIENLSKDNELDSFLIPALKEYALQILESPMEENPNLPDYVLNFFIDFVSKNADKFENTLKKETEKTSPTSDIRKKIRELQDDFDNLKKKPSIPFC